MPTATTHRAIRGRPKTPAPFSTTAANLIKQIQAEARDQLLAELSAKDAVVVLQGFDAASKYVRCTGEALYIHDDKDNSLVMYRRHTFPDSWADSQRMRELWHPARWNGTECFVDTQGRKWERETGYMVCDDFGNLVEVAV